MTACAITTPQRIPSVELIIFQNAARATCSSLRKLRSHGMMKPTSSAAEEQPKRSGEMQARLLQNPSIFNSSCSYVRRGHTHDKVLQLMRVELEPGVYRNKKNRCSNHRSSQ
jgi:hypothetical protein